MEKAISILKQEVRWHQENKNISGISEDWKNGFIRGCEHCTDVLLKCNDVLSKIDDGILDTRPKGGQNEH